MRQSLLVFLFQDQKRVKKMALQINFATSMDQKVEVAAEKVAQLKEELNLTSGEAVSLGRALIDNPPLADSFIIRKSMDVREMKRPLWAWAIVLAPIGIAVLKFAVGAALKKKRKKEVRVI